MITFLEYFNSNSILEEDIEYADLKAINPSRISREMEELETTNYSSGLAQGASDLEKDFTLPGFTGVGMFDKDNKKTLGYMYGYAMSDDEMSDLKYIDDSDITFYNQEFRDLISNTDVSQIFTSENTFYVANFNANRKFGGYAYIMIGKLLRDIRGQGYKYLMFDGLSDTTNLFIKNGKIEGKKLARVGLDILATAKTGYSLLGLMRIR
jgi:hypothetical protein